MSALDTAKTKAHETRINNLETKAANNTKNITTATTTANTAIAVTNKISGNATYLASVGELNFQGQIGSTGEGSMGGPSATGGWTSSGSWSAAGATWQNNVYNDLVNCRVYINALNSTLNTLITSYNTMLTGLINNNLMKSH